MKRQIAHILPLAFAIIAMLSTRSLAAFEEHPGIRLNALGGAAVADRGDAMGFFINPAAIAWGTSSAIEMHYTKLYWGLENDNLARNGIGGFSSLTNWGALGLGHDQLESNLYHERRTLFSYARLFGERLAIGLNLGLLGRGYRENEYTAIDPLFIENGYSRNSFSLDLGAQYRFSPALTFGLALRQLNRPNQAIDENAEDPLPRHIEAGIAWKIKNTILFADLEYKDVKVNGIDITPRLGVETNFFTDKFFLRGGVNRDEIATGFGLNVYKKVSTSSFARPLPNGKREKINERRDLRFKLGYTFRYPVTGLTSISGSHLLGLTVFFDRRVQAAASGSRPDKGPTMPVQKRIITKIDTVFVPKIEYVEIIKVDSSRIEAYKVELLELREQISSLRSMNNALDHLGGALKLYYQKLYDEAIAETNRAINLVPNLALAHIRKASILFAQAKFLESKQEYEEALKHDPGNKEVLKMLETINKRLQR